MTVSRCRCRACRIGSWWRLTPRPLAHFTREDADVFTLCARPMVGPIFPAVPGDVACSVCWRIFTTRYLDPTERHTTHLVLL